MSKHTSSWRKYGMCEYCNSWSQFLKLMSIVSEGSILYLNDRERTFYNKPFWACGKCQGQLSRIGTTSMEEIDIKSIDVNLLDVNLPHIRQKMVRKFKGLEDLFPGEIDGIYLLPKEGLPKKFSKKTNVIVSFKSLCLLKYFNFVVRNDDKNLLSIWKDDVQSKAYSRSKYFNTKITRILLALSRIQASSELVSIWIWADTRIVSVDFFCKKPVNMIQATPQRIMRIK